VTGATLCRGRAEDAAELIALYRAAFPDEELGALVTALLDLASEVSSLTARDGGRVVGHVAVTACGLDGHPTRLALLGPLAVAPGHQRQGIGSTLVREALSMARADGAAAICVLGDPAYYGRFGLRPETAITPPCPIPDDWRPAWQSLGLGDAGERPSGRLIVPAPWRDPALWAP